MSLDLRSIVDALSQGVTSIGQAPAGAPAKLWEETRGWMGRFFSSAMEKWVAAYSRQDPCAVKVLRGGVPFPCAGFAVLSCGACGNPTCVNHAQVDQHGEGTCYHCVAELIMMKRAARVAGHKPPPSGEAGAQGSPPDVRDAIVRRALTALGLKADATWDEIRAAHRKLAAKHHPDRARSDAQRKKSQEASVKINSAFADLQRLYKQEAAA